jgi:glutathione S-transferase
MRPSAEVAEAWTNFHNIDLKPYPNLRAFMDRVAARPRRGYSSSV